LQKKDKTRDKYATVSYPDLSKDLCTCFEEILGDKVYYSPVIDVYRQKLRNPTPTPPKASLPESERKTPSFLRIVASSDVTLPANRLEGESESTAVLKWDVVKGYIGSVADIMTTKPKSVYQ